MKEYVKGLVAAPFKSWRYFLGTLALIVGLALTTIAVLEHFEPGITRWLLEQFLTATPSSESTTKGG